MIIKKKFANIKKISEEVPSDIEVQNKPEGQEKPIPQAVKQTPLDIKTEGSEIKEEQKQKKKKVNNLDLTLENITFEQRAERRDGSRRRGYRRTQDRNIISRAQEEAKTIKDAAKQEGYEDGIAKATSDLTEIKGKLSEFFKYKDEIFNEVAGCIYEIAVETAKKIIKKEIENDKDVTIEIIKGALEEVNKTENRITLKVMPQDVEIVRDKVPQMFKNEFTEAKISVIPDQTIKDGGVIVETSNGIIDATVETQISIIEKALTNKEES